MVKAAIDALNRKDLDAALKDAAPDFEADYSRALGPWRAVDGTVLAQIVQHGKGRASGIEGDNRYFQLFTFRGQKIVRMESIMDEAEALEAVGLSE